MPCLLRNTPDPQRADHVRALAPSRVRTRPKASRLEAVCALYGAHAPRAWSCGFFKAARRLGPFVWCLRDDVRGVRGGIDRDEGSSSPRGAEGQPYAGTSAHEPRCFEANGVDVESIEAGVDKHHTIVSEGPGSANCAGSRAPPTVTVMHAPRRPTRWPDNEGSA
jgi:hypothetical protein